MVQRERLRVCLAPDEVEGALGMGNLAVEDVADEVAAALEAGDHDLVVEILVTQYGDEVYRYCRRMLGNSVDTDDVSQVVFVQVFQCVNALRDVRNLRSWILGIARHRCLDRLKAIRRRPEMPALGEVDEFPDRAMADHVATADPRVRKALDECLDRLDARSRAALVLRFHHGMSFTAISGLIPNSPGALRVRVARALPALRRCLETKGVTP